MITPAQLASIGQAVAAGSLLADLRQRFPELHFTACSDDDVSPRYSPVAELPGHRLYLVAGSSGHCLTLTNDPGSASGLLLAATEDDA